MAEKDLTQKELEEEIENLSEEDILLCKHFPFHTKCFISLFLNKTFATVGTIFTNSKHWLDNMFQSQI